VRHVLDSLAGRAVLAARSIDRFVDLGSGGGFPGMPLAAALPAERALLVDSTAKKARFLDTVASATGLERRVVALAERVESVAADPTDRGAWPAVTARAVASLAELIELGLPLLSAGGILLAWKRRAPHAPDDLRAELTTARAALDAVDRGATIELTDELPDRMLAVAPDLAGHRLVLVSRSAAQIAPDWPRDPAARRRHPW
jgi:16S rRNA (guanine(527)-N(7))-methyltransferase RsmG